MRLGSFLVAALLLVACSKDDSGDGLCYCPDAGAFDLGAPTEGLVQVDLGTADAGSDAGADAGADLGPADAGVDVWLANDHPGPLSDQPDVGGDVVDVSTDNGCTELFCGGACVRHTIMNCGGCGVVCPQPAGAHTVPRCTSFGEVPTCGSGCAESWANCNGDLIDGCEYFFGPDGGGCPPRP